MSDLSALQRHYDYWDSFVRLWKSGHYPRALHLPEPWWGWTPEDGSLHSVCVNLSPGAGGKLQTRRCIDCAMGCIKCDSYSAAMLDGTLRRHLEMTEHWHFARRYKPLMLSIGIAAHCIHPDTRHHLSVELAPFHDKFSNEQFLGEHSEDAILHTLKFAAEAARLIVAPGSDKSSSSPLINRVIVRAAIENIRKFADGKIDENTFSVTNYKGESISVDTFRLKYQDFEDVWFICLSGTHNNLPSKDNIKQILSQINQSINSQKV